MILGICCRIANRDRGLRIPTVVLFRDDDSIWFLHEIRNLLHFCIERPLNLLYVRTFLFLFFVHRKEFVYSQNVVVFFFSLLSCIKLMKVIFILFAGTNLTEQKKKHELMLPWF